MNLWHHFSYLYLIGGLNLLQLIALNNPTLAVTEISKSIYLNEVRATDSELRLELSLDKDSIQASSRTSFAPQIPPAISTTSVQMAREDISQAPIPTLEGQVTSVTQLKDVQPSDWAFAALQSLIERYGVIAAYPDGRFKGNRAMTRYEFAVALNACLERVNELIVQGTTSPVTRHDLITMQRLQEEFTAELTTLRSHVDGLEVRANSLEANQFSITTKLKGQVIFAVGAGTYDGDSIVSPNGEVITNEDLNATSFYRVSLDLDTSFSGTDLLKIRIGTGSNGINDNIAGVLEPNFGSVLDFSAKPGRNGNLGIDRLYYSFKPWEDFKVSIGPDIRTTDYVDLNSYANQSFRDFSTQALVNNYILVPINGPSAGAAVDWNPAGSSFTIRAVYAAVDADNPGSEGGSLGTSLFTQLLYPDGGGEGGLFAGTYQGIVELEYSPSKNFAFRLQYTGGSLFDNRFDVFGANIEWTLADRVGLFGRYGYGNYNGTAFGDLNPSYWMAGISLRDLWKKGDFAGFAASQPFIEGDVGNATQTNFEAFYNFLAHDNIRITPLVQVIVNPGNQEDNGTIITGTLRTVFSF